MLLFGSRRAHMGTDNAVPVLCERNAIARERKLKTIKTSFFLLSCRANPATATAAFEKRKKENMRRSTLSCLQAGKSRGRRYHRPTLLSNDLKARYADPAVLAARIVYTPTASTTTAFPRRELPLELFVAEIGQK